MSKANQSLTRRPSYRGHVQVIVVLQPWIGYCPENVAERNYVYFPRMAVENSWQWYQTL